MRTEKVNYRATLQLPRTDFPMKAGLATKEPALLERWSEIGIYDRLREKLDRPAFILHDGPPYANGHLHIGHALNKILKDMVVRSQQMMGKDARYVPGWDCHGLPIEWKVEENNREHGIEKSNISSLNLRQECRDFASKWVDIQREEFQRLGVTGKWDDPYLTMDFHAEAVIAQEFMKFLMNGTLYRGFKPVMWSTVEQTALAEAEIEYEDITSKSIWVRFPINYGASPDLSEFELPDKTSILIWTTTPWTIPSNRAICFNKSIDYALYEVVRAPVDNWLVIGDRLIIAEKLVSGCMEVARVSEFRKVQSVSSETLSKLICKHPFYGKVPVSEPDVNRWDYDVPLLNGEHVQDDVGTGFVHTAPSHGDDDYKTGQKHGLTVTHNVTKDGKFRSTLPIFGGREIYTQSGREGDANDLIVCNLIDQNCLVGINKFRHSYPHSWRSKAPVIYRTTPQWFVDIDKDIDDNMDALGKSIRERALKSIMDEVKWTPASGQIRLYTMISARPDWVLSRQRVWGVPLTCFVKKNVSSESNEYLLHDETVNRRIIDAFEKEGADAWYRPDAKERFLTDLYDPELFDQVFDILDVWFDSGSTHSFVLRDRSDGTDDGIADLYLEGTDQHRGWFHSSMLQACGTIGSAPYRGVLTHGFTLDQHGRKMAKSVGNTVAPDEVVKQYGADILRLWVAHSDYTSDLRIGPDVLKATTEIYRRVRNAFRFILGNLNEFDESQRVVVSDMPELERWVLHRLAVIDQKIRHHYSSYQFREAFIELFDFINLDLSPFYFDIRKDILYCGLPDGNEQHASHTVLEILFEYLTAWLAPILPFTMEEVWLHRKSGETSSIHLQDFPAVPASWNNETIARKWNDIRMVRRVVTAAIEPQRVDKKIGSSLEAAPLVYINDKALLATIRNMPFADICIVSQIQLLSETIPNHAFQLSEIDGVGVIFSIANGNKCSRCWKILPDVGNYSHPETCKRCNSVLSSIEQTKVQPVT